MRRRRLLSTLLVLCMVLVLVPGTATAAGIYTLPEGYDIANMAKWSFPTIEGETVTQDTYIGKIQILIFFRANGNCLNSNSTIRSIANADWVKSDNVQVIAVGNGEANEEAQTAREHVISFKQKYAPDSEDIVFCYATHAQMWQTTYPLRPYIFDGSPNYIFYAMNFMFDGENHLRYAWDGEYKATYYTDAIARLNGQEPGEEDSSNISYPVTGGNIYFDTATGTITGCDVSVTEAIIPHKINNITVVSIGRSAFAGCYRLISVTIPDSVTNIGYYAFSRCISLTSITIPNSVAAIRSMVFYSCGSLTSVTIPNRVTDIGSAAFGACKNLTSVTIPNSVTSIDNGAFDSCRSLTDVYYSGGESDWKRIQISDGYNEYLLNATIHYNTTGPDQSNPDIPDPSELHGKVSVSANYAPGGTTIQVTLTPDPGYMTGRVTVTEDISGEIVPVTGSENFYSFKMPHKDVTIHVDFVPQ